MRLKNANNRVRSRSAKKDAARQTRPANAWVTNRWPSLRAAAPALTAIIAAATLIALAGLFQRSDSSIASAAPATTVSEATPPPVPPDTTNAATELVPPATAPQTRTPDTSAVSKRVVESPRTTAVESAPQADAKPAPPANSPLNAEPQPPAEPLIGADATNEGAVTISGCLEARDDSFWLKDTSGANAPKSRSWKSGFLKKHAESVKVVDATKSLQLSNFVAQRVTATGTLANRTMQARSLERVAASCH